MFEKHYDNYKRLSPLKKLIVSYIINWIFWLLAWLILGQFILNDKQSYGYHLFHATWMSFFTTITFNWKEIKQILNQQKNITEDSEKSN